MTLPPSLPASMPAIPPTSQSAIPPLLAGSPLSSQDLPPVPPLLQKPFRKINHLSVWQLVLSVIALVCSFGVVILVLISLLGEPAAGSTALELTTILWIFILFTASCIPSLILSIRNIKGIELRVFTLSNKSLFIAGGALLLGAGLIYLVYRLGIQSLPGLLAGLLNILVIALPVIAWVIVGSHGLKAQSTQRLWGVFNVSQFISTSAAMVIEILMAILVVVAAIGWLVQQAEFVPYLTLFQNQGSLTEMQIQSLAYDIQPLIKTPLIYTFVVLGMCLFVPMVEELLKPLGVWFFVGKRITPSEGFFLGLLGGAGFALVESLLVMGSASDAWVSTVIGRVGTGLLHVTTAGILGRAMAKSWQDGRYSRISLTYLGMIVLHGIWNFFALLLAVKSAVIPIESSLIEVLLPSVEWVLCGLGVGMIVLLTLVNHRLQKEARPPSFPVVITPQQNPERNEIPIQ